ncbi:rhamnan synthesis F family protein [Hydrogenophaga sp.]|uniref:rhamnan synthesis F family protein n=1 Tax=Hydrogenophaga sp. TaxID=1904254 RepID=UPI0025B8DE87|nr:rhamnan synthesis F family protein [Hydrogenophaga sp.]MBT9465981.1 hypothetical protein [Hydrogenophaga sp.]
MIPLWKIQREWQSLQMQLDAVVDRIVGPARQRRRDAAFPSALRAFDGSDALHEKVAIFLVYQPHGVAATVRQTCEHLSYRGYSVLLVSNTPLGNSDRDDLSHAVWRFVERDNFGYDFGGYRDGIQLLQHWGIAPEQTLVLNDSIWFPVRPDETLTQQFEASPAGFIGAFRFVDPPAHDTEHAGIFLSYMLCFKKSVWLSDAFRDYWRNYICTSNKMLTVKRGERGLSRALFAAGLPSEGVYSRDRLLAAIARQSNAFLRLALNYAAYTDASLQDERNALLLDFADQESWRLRALIHIEAVAVRRNPLSVFCYASMHLLGVPFLKKNRGELQVRMRQQYVRAVTNGDLPHPGEAAWAEIQAGNKSA